MPPSPTHVEQPPPPLSRANSTMSLYQSCLNLIERLSVVPDFQQYLGPDILAHVQASSPSSLVPSDPVNMLWDLFRMGAPLACIFNGLRPASPLRIDPMDPTLSNINACKATVFYFLMACSQQLGFTEVQLFTISELFQNDTNGFVKVIRTVSLVLDRMESQGLIRVQRSKRNSDPVRPTDHRAKVVQEILETERNYVCDLEQLQEYMRALQAENSISPETIHRIFANLNSLVDFQRRFLIAIETHAALAAPDQNFGLVFTQHEQSFAVYEPYCANVNEASELVSTLFETFQRLNIFGDPQHLLNQQNGLNSYIIKPAQRICKYHLFMQQLVRLDQEHPHYQDLLQGLESTKHAAERVNETIRQQENHVRALQLQHQVAWKDGERVADFGDLLLYETLLNPRGSTDAALEVFLFEKILVCCQNIVSKKKPSKALTRSSKPTKPTMFLNGRIYISNIKSILPVSVAGSHILHVVWNVAAEEFELRCHDEADLKKWHGVLDKLVSEAQARQAALATANHAFGASGLSHENQSSFFNEDDDYLEDELEGDDEDAYDDPHTLYDYSMSHGHENLSQSTFPGSRSRAKTEEGSANPGGTWNGRAGGYTANALAHGRPSLPGMSLPPLPRTTSSSSTAMGVASPGECPFSPPSSYPASPTVSNPRGSQGSWPQRRSQGEDNLPLKETMAKFLSQETMETAPLPGQPLTRNASMGYSYNATPAPSLPLTSIPGQLRVRAQSSPNIHAAATNPPWLVSANAGRQRHHRQPSNASGSGSPPMTYLEKEIYPPVPAVPAVPPMPLQRSSPRLDQMPLSNHRPLNGQLKIKINFQEDAYLIAVPVDTGYRELIERVEKKIRLCGSRRSDDQPLRLRYKDEDNDYIIMKDDDDISLAFESCLCEGVMNLHVT